MCDEKGNFRKTRAIVCVKIYFDHNKKEFRATESTAQLTENALEMGVSTVNRVMADFRRDPSLLDKAPTPKGRPDYAIDNSHEEFVRGFIRKANQNGQYVTTSTLSDFIQEIDPDSRFHRTTLTRALDHWGFEFGKGTRSQHLKGKGERLIIINAISSTGWMRNAKLVFQSKRKTGDYHGQMNSELFQKWFSEKLMPNIPGKSLIVMDNPPYHKTLSSFSPPTPSLCAENASHQQQQKAERRTIDTFFCSSVCNCRTNPIFVIPWLQDFHILQTHIFLSCH